jgi:hypothetical protein
MVGASLASWLLIRAARSDVEDETLFGMLGPLVSACVTWLAIEWAHRTAPQQVMAVMIGGFAVKMVFFGGYVALMLRGLELQAVPFVVSFTGYFIALYAMEALFLRRLTLDAPR